LANSAESLPPHASAIACILTIVASLSQSSNHVIV
jgi:hypothetical protein